MNKSFAIFLLCFICSTINTLGQLLSIPKDSMQSIFKPGTIISIKEDVGCYRSNGLQVSGSYGYCMYDKKYEPKISLRGYSWDKEKGEIETYTNSKCYTIIPPIFDYAQPFSEGWGAVCKDKKWSYVSQNGTFMCDFVLDAAYPFKDGNAKVIFNGINYEIDKYGNGLPQEINRNTRIINRQLQAQTINQLCEEKQFEKAIEKGDALYKEILYSSNTQLYDVSADELIYGIQAEYAAISSKNSLMAMLHKRPELFDYYQGIDLDLRFSVESGLYELNYYNSRYYFQFLRERYPSDSLVNQILYYAEDLNYKSAILLYEKWVKKREISLKESGLELIVYFYLAELSDDFETANELLPSIAKLYERNGFDWIEDDYLMGSLLLNIRKYQSANTRFNQAIKSVRNNNDVLKEVICYFNIACLYKTVKEDDQCLSYYKRAFDALQQCRTNSITAEIRNGILSSYIDYLLSKNLWSDNYSNLLEKYIQSEIDYNTNVFVSNDILHINRIWGKSLVRIQKVLQHLDNSKNDSFLKGAFTLAVFQQSITSDFEKIFVENVSATKNEEIRQLVTLYWQSKKDYKGFDLYDVGESNSLNKEMASKIGCLEKDIKTKLLDEGCLRWDVNYFALLKGLKKDEIIIDVVEYTVNSTIKKYGVFIIKGKEDVKFETLGKEDRFSSKNFWPIITRSCQIGVNDNFYLFLGKLDGTGLEYENIENEGIAFLKYNLHRVSSFANVNKSFKKKSLNRISLFGGLEYGEELVAKNRGAIENGYLEYSKTEVDAICNIMKDNMIVNAYLGKDGTTERFLSHEVSSSDIIHLATHGYQKDLNVLQWTSIESYANKDRFNYYRQNTDVENMEWLMRNTGLFFSISDKDSVNVLYSREVSTCDLSNTSLVVLSACSTLSGNKSDNYSGSVSLTTAFTIAQAQNIITSLWDVDDEKTYEFMTTFYRKLKETDDIYNSFRNTVKEMKSNYPSRKDIWGAFVLLENHN